MFEETPTPPLVFANHVVQQYIEHLFGPDMLIEPNDYMAIRLVFRQKGGSWQEIGGGNIKHLSLLQQVVTAWGQMPGRKTEEDELV